jgi:hypothetical protein
VAFSPVALIEYGGDIVVIGNHTGGVNKISCSGKGVKLAVSASTGGKKKLKPRSLLRRQRTN